MAVWQPGHVLPSNDGRVHFLLSELCDYIHSEWSHTHGVNVRLVHGGNFIPRVYVVGFWLMELGVEFDGNVSLYRLDMRGGPWVCAYRPVTTKEARPCERKAAARTKKHRKRSAFITTNAKSVSKCGGTRIRA